MLPGVCPQTNPRGALSFFFFKGIGMDQQRSGISRDSGWYHTHASVSVAVSVRQGNRDTSSKQWCFFLRRPLLHSHTSERSSSLTLSQGSRHGNSHPFISSSSFQSLSGDLYRTTPTDLSRDVRGVCNLSNGIVNVISIAIPFHGTLRFSFHRCESFD